MTPTQPTVLVLGGTGKTGSRVAARLRNRGHEVRIGSRSGQPRFDWQDDTTWHTVLQGATAVYLAYSPDIGFPGAAETVGAFTRAAAASGVTHVVLLSGRGEPGALRSEQAVRHIGIDWTIVRSSFFAQDFSEDEAFAESVRAGLVALPAGDTAEPFVDAEDVADVAVAALTGEGHIGEVYEVTGPRLLTFGQAVAEIAAATRRDITYLPVSGEQFVSGLVSEGAPVEFATQLTALFTEILDGRNAHLTDGVRRVLGRAPRDFGDYVHEVAASDTWTRPVTAHEYAPHTRQ